MIRQCFILKTGLLFHKTKLIGLEPDTLYPHVLPCSLPGPLIRPPDQLRQELQKDDRGGRTLRE